MRRILVRLAAAGAGAVLALAALTGPAAAAGGSAGNSTAADLAALKASNGGRAVVLVDNVRAAGGMDACESGSFCAWDNYNYSGGPGQWSGNADNYSHWGHSGCGLGSLWTWDNCASSVYNNGNSCNIQLYDDIKYSTAHGYYNLAKGGHLADLRKDKMTDGKPMNDRISSHQWCAW
jgi:hypothetical protein